MTGGRKDEDGKARFELGMGTRGVKVGGEDI